MGWRMQDWMGVLQAMCHQVQGCVHRHNGIMSVDRPTFTLEVGTLAGYSCGYFMYTDLLIWTHSKYLDMCVRTNTIQITHNTLMIYYWPTWAHMHLVNKPY